MAKVIEVTAGATALFGRQIEKIVDVSEDCPALDRQRRAILTFTRHNGQRNVELLRTHPGEDSIGMAQSYFLVELEHDSFAERFQLWSRLFGHDADVLKKLIFENAPAI